MPSRRPIKIATDQHGNWDMEQYREKKKEPPTTAQAITELTACIRYYFALYLMMQLIPLAIGLASGYLKTRGSR